MRCWSNIERVFEELEETWLRVCQEVAVSVDLELLGAKGCLDINDLNARY